MLSSQANAAISDSHYVAIRHCCEMFVREVIQAVYGDKYDDVFRPSARLTAAAWQQAGLGFVPDHFGNTYQPGDILYKTIGDGPDGHVGIYVGSIMGVGDHLVAENSSTSIGRIQGAKGYRTLEQFGTVNVVVRLPEPDVYIDLILHDQVIDTMPMTYGICLVNIRSFAQALGLSVTYDPESNLVFFGNQRVNTPVVMRGGHGCLPVRDAVAAVGLVVSLVDLSGGKVVISRP